MVFKDHEKRQKRHINNFFLAFLPDTKSHSHKYCCWALSLCNGSQVEHYISRRAPLTIFSYLMLTPIVDSCQVISFCLFARANNAIYIEPSDLHKCTQPSSLVCSVAASKQYSKRISLLFQFPSSTTRPPLTPLT